MGHPVACEVMAERRTIDNKLEGTEEEGRERQMNVKSKERLDI